MASSWDEASRLFDHLAWVGIWARPLTEVAGEQPARFEMLTAIDSSGFVVPLQGFNSSFGGIPDRSYAASYACTLSLFIDIIQCFSNLR